MSFKIGQRWVSQTEPKLGLGIIAEFESRRIAISFPAAGESRTYATDNAPISRVMYKSGDNVANHEDIEYTVVDVEEHNDLLAYQVADVNGDLSVLSEVDLNCFIQFTTPLQRLVSGHYDRNRAFRLRYETLQHLHRLQQSPMTGLLGSRTALLAHQIYIADTVSNRFAPRVLLADEVGLGKTIEAGMIIHAQLHKGLGRRVLVCVPSTLIYQWLVEMLRRFNLHFSIFDEARYDSLLEEGAENPFEAEQLILCETDFLANHTQAQKHAVAAEWDLFVVDEAHHLEWSETESSPEYQCVEAISLHSKGVLLLTATPEQAGIESHFARLRLLDPERFHSFAQFNEQEKHYGEISELVKQVQVSVGDDVALSPNLKEALARVLGDQLNIDLDAELSELAPLIIDRLLDLHGTGRILFRNTRQGIEGFPQRHLKPYALEQSEQPSTIKEDARMQWLMQFLHEQREEKVLVICASAERALEIEAYLRLREGMRTSAFHEGLSIIERDRAAAYFADKEDGAQALICSEIGSEGRNFQFAHNLVLFDLPTNPDLLEQRIGRLDRIGQMRDVQIHVPYQRNSAQEAWFLWYHKALDAFEQSCAAGYAIQQYFAAPLQAFIDRTEHSSEAARVFLDEARNHRDAVMEDMQKGRNPLLELNSCKPDIADALIEQLEEEEGSQALAGYMERSFNLFGVEQEPQSDATVVIHPGEHMLEHDFPRLSAEGCTLTYHRMKALVREEVEFLTWEHPMVTELMEQMLTSELGNAALAKMSVKGVQPGTLFLECIFTLNAIAPKYLQLERFLPISPQRLVVDITGRDLSEVLPHEKLNELCSGIKRSLAPALVKEVRAELSTLLSHAQKIVEAKLPSLLDKAREKLDVQLNNEIDRLKSLMQTNPLIRIEELDFLQDQKSQGLALIDKTGLDVQAMRLIINT